MRRATSSTWSSRLRPPGAPADWVGQDVTRPGDVITVRMPSPRTATLPAGCRRSSLPMAASCVTRSLAEMRQRLGSIPRPEGRSMRTPSIVVSVVVLACLTTVAGRAQRRGPKGSFAKASPGCRILLDRLPRDLSGVWVGPIDNKPDPVPPMTPAGEALFKERKPYGDASRNANGSLERSVHHLRSLGFPRNLLAHAVSSRGRFIFGSAPDRLLITASSSASGVRSGWTDERCQKPWM